MTAFLKPTTRRDYSGGINLRDAAMTLAENEWPYGVNVTPDERGGMLARLGFTKENASTLIATTDIVNLWFWKTTGQLVAQVGARLFKRTSPGTWSEIERAAGADAFTTSARATFCDFAGLLVAVHPVDGVLTYNGAGNIAVVNATVTGSCCAVWQNKVWAGVGVRMYWSNAGSASTWTTGTDFADLRDVNDDDITAMVVADRGGLIVCKERSTHRVYDSIAGAYNTISAELGASGALAAISYENRAYLACARGVSVTDGLSPPVIVTDRIEPVFHPGQLQMAKVQNMALGLHEDNLVLSLARFGSNFNNQTWEFDPSVGWWTPYSFGASAFATDLSGDRRTYHSHPGASSGDRAFVYKDFDGGTDDGAAITSVFQTGWVELGAMNEVNLRQIAVAGLGDPTMYVLKDFAASGTLRDVDFSVPGSVWGGGGLVWGGAGLFWAAGGVREVYDRVFSCGKGRSFGLRFEKTASTTLSRPALLGDGQVEAIGSWGFFGATYHPVTLGRR